MYKIRKSNNGRTYGFSGKILGISIAFIIFGLFRITFLIIGNIEDLQGTDFIIFLCGASIFLIIGLVMYTYTSKIYNAKKLKRNGNSTIKKIEISSIERYKTELNKDSFDGYYLQAKDGDIIYCSDGILKNKVKEVVLNSDLTSIYKSYGYEYDDKETYKKDVLYEIDKQISESQHETQEGRFLQRKSAKTDLSNLQHEKKLVESGYQTPYIVIDGQKISVGDTVDVYINPNNEKNYWMDTDFLFKK